MPDPQPPPAIVPSTIQSASRSAEVDAKNDASESESSEPFDLFLLGDESSVFSEEKAPAKKSTTAELPADACVREHKERLEREQAQFTEARETIETWDSEVALSELGDASSIVLLPHLAGFGIRDSWDFGHKNGMRSFTLGFAVGVPSNFGA